MVLDARLDGEEVVVTGWAHLPDARITGVVLRVAGTTVGGAAVGRPTPELPHLGPVTPRSPTAGWEVRFHRSLVRTGPVRYEADAIRADGLVDHLDPLVATVNTTAVGAMDPPHLDVTFEPPLMVVTGWLLPTAGYDRVEVRLGDEPPQRARPMSLGRGDVAAMLPREVGAAMCGWMAIVELPAGMTETVAVEAVAIGPAGQVVVGRTAMDVPSSAPLSPPAGLEAAVARTNVAARAHCASSYGLRILVATHHLGLGGGQLYLSELLRQLVDGAPVSCTVLAPEDGPLREDLEAWGCEVHLVGAMPTSALQYEHWLLSVGRLVAETEANVVLANTAGAFYAVDLAMRAGLPSVWAVHESFSPRTMAAVGFPGLEGHLWCRFQTAIAQANAIVFEADATALLYAPAGDGRDRFVRIDYGIDLEAVDRCRAGRDRAGRRLDAGFEPDDIVLLCVGTYEPRKAQTALVAAFARVAGRHPRATLVLVGENGSAYAIAVRDLVAGLGLEDRVRLVPVVPDTYAWYACADALVSASDVESLPRSMLEAMAFGVPVLGTAVFGVAELITDGDNGLLCEPLDVGALASGLHRLLSLHESGELASIAARGEADVRAHRDSRGYGDIYRGLLYGLRDRPTATARDILD
jgi:glycosyltransferase involved in cell wall biosynthesis